MNSMTHFDYISIPTRYKKLFELWFMIDYIKKNTKEDVSEYLDFWNQCLLIMNYNKIDPKIIPSPMRKKDSRSTLWLSTYMDVCRNFVNLNHIKNMTARHNFIVNEFPAGKIYFTFIDDDNYRTPIFNNKLANDIIMQSEFVINEIE